MAGTQQCVSLVPQLIDALVTLTRAAFAAAGANVTVYDYNDDQGTGEGGLGDYLIVGSEGPALDGTGTDASTNIAWATARGVGGSANDESGYVSCVAVCSVGDNSAKECRDGAYAIAATVSKVIAADPTLGIGPWVQGCRFGSQTRLTQVSDEDGAAALLTFQVAFAARIYPPA